MQTAALQRCRFFVNVILTTAYTGCRRLGEKPVGRKTFGRIILLGDRRLGDNSHFKKRRFAEKRLAGWATKA